MGMNKVYVQAITLSTTGDWMRTRYAGNPTLKQQWISLSWLQRIAAIFPYEGKDNVVRFAQAAAVKFSDGTIWDNDLNVWR